MKSAVFRTAAFVVIAAQIAAEPALASAQSPPEIKAVFEQELFELAHTVFLANANLKEALAVSQRPASVRVLLSLARRTSSGVGGRSPRISLVSRWISAIDSLVLSV